MIKKNSFLIFNNVVCELYRCQTYEELGTYFLPMLNMLIPYRYASIMRRDQKESSVQLIDPLCVPKSFEEAERNYMRFASDDYTGWLSCCRESVIVRESDLMGEQQRLRSLIYQKCYQKFNVHDTLYLGIVYNGKPLGALSLFRQREDGPFTSEDIFFLRNLGIHVNQHFNALLEQMYSRKGLNTFDLSAFSERYGLTNREVQLLTLLAKFRDNQEIASILQVRESTLQKHFQNMFRKFGVSSRWELMRLLLEEDPRS